MSDLVERLRGKYRVPITDGLGPAGGEEPDNGDFFVRSFPSSPLALEAAERISELEVERTRLMRLLTAAGQELAEARSHGPGHKPNDPIAKREAEGETEAE